MQQQKNKGTYVSLFKFQCVYPPPYIHRVLKMIELLRLLQGHHPKW